MTWIMDMARVISNELHNMGMSTAHYVADLMLGIPFVALILFNMQLRRLVKAECRAGGGDAVCQVFYRIATIPLYSWLVAGAQIFALVWFGAASVILIVSFIDYGDAPPSGIGRSAGFAWLICPPAGVALSIWSILLHVKFRAAVATACNHR